MISPENALKLSNKAILSVDEDVDKIIEALIDPIIINSANMGLKNVKMNIRESTFTPTISENRPFIMALTFSQRVDLIFNKLHSIGYKIKKSIYYEEDSVEHVCILDISWEEK